MTWLGELRELPPVAEDASEAAGDPGLAPRDDGPDPGEGVSIA